MQRQTYNVVVVPLLTARQSRIALGHLDRALACTTVQTEGAFLEQSRFCVLKDLIAALQVAKRGAHVLVRAAAQRVQAEVELVAAYLAHVVVVDGQRRLRVDVAQVPGERLALQVLAQLDAFAHVARVHGRHALYDLVEEGRVLVRPHVHHASVVLCDDVHLAARERVRRRLAEHVAHVATRHEQNCAATHPNLYRKNILQSIENILNETNYN